MSQRFVRMGEGWGWVPPFYASQANLIFGANGRALPCLPQIQVLGMSKIEAVQPAGAPPGGHYSPGIVHSGVVYVSGQLPFVPGDTERRLGSVAEQAEQALRNVESVLQAAGTSLDRVLQMTIYISDGDDWGTVNEVYSRVLGDHRPARAVVPVSPLHYGAAIEIQAIAATL